MPIPFRPPRVPWRVTSGAVLLALAPAGAPAQARWQAHRAADAGLPSDQIQALAAAGDTVWVGTAAGLARFDGAVWTTYTPATTGLPGPYVTDVAPDGRGGVWVGTTAGIARFDGARWHAYTAATSPLPSDDVADLDVDGDAVWVATAAGLARFDGARWAVFDETNAPVLDHLVRSVAVGPDGVVWAGTFDAFGFNGRLLRYDGDAWVRHRLADHGWTSSFPDALVVDRHGTAWAGLKGTTGGALVQVRDGEVTVFDRTDAGLPTGAVSDLALDGDTLWVGTADGVARFDGGRWRTFGRRTDGLPDDVVTAVAVDGRGRTWAGTLRSGVAVSVPHVGTSVERPDGPGAGGLTLDAGPNPARRTVRLSYRLPSDGPVRLAVFDGLGRRVATLAEGPRAAGRHEVTWDAAALPAGPYLVRLTAGGRHAARLVHRVE